MSVQITDNSAEALAGLERAKARTLETIGLKAEGYAKRLCPVGTVESTGIKGYRGGTLRNSITHTVDSDVLSVGSNIPYWCIDVIVIINITQHLIQTICIREVHSFV